MNTPKLVAGLALAAGGLIWGGANAYAAGGGYGPVPPSTGAPGGFSSVLNSEMIGSSGGNLTATSGGVTIEVNVPAGSLNANDDIVVTSGNTGATTPALANLGYGNYKSIADFGISLLDANGAKITGTFNPPITVTFSGAGFGAAGEQVIELTGPNSAKAVPYTLGNGSVTVTINSDPDLAVLAPVSTATTGTTGTAAPTATSSGNTVSGATTQHTGMPFLGEEVGAGALTVVGGASLGLSRRRRRQV